MNIIHKTFFLLLLITFIISIFYSNQIHTLSPFITSNLKIYRDQQGLAHVLAYNKPDLYFGMGYAQAQDRLWGLFFKKMLMQGRLCEIFGDKALPIDNYMRNINLKGIGEQNSAILDKQTKIYLQKFADGINEFAKSTKILPFQFYLFWKQWQQWTIVDSNNVVALYHFILEFDWMYELIRQRLKQTIGYQFAMKLLPSNAKQLFEQITIIKDDELKQMNRYSLYNSTQYRNVIDQHWKNLHFNFSIDQFQNLNSAHKNGGSNAWAIGGNFTESGKPILSNDPHLGLTNPTPLYPIQLIILDQNNQIIHQAFGVISDGLPGLSIGKNKKFAWGSTALYSDCKDLFLQTLKQQNGKRYYLLDGVWMELKQRKQIFKVRNSQQIVQIFYETHRGPLINTIFMDMYLKYGISVADHHKNMISLQSTVYQPDNSTIKAMMDLAFINKSQDFFKATDEMKIVNIDSVFITHQKQFGYVSIGRIPKKNIQQMGSFIKDGSTSHHDHLQYYTSDEMPKLFNPTRGYVAMTNNKFASDNFDLRGSLHQISNGRASRLQYMIQQIMKSGRKFNFDDMRRMQQDVKDSFVEKSLKQIIKIFKQNKKYWENKIFGQRIIQILQGWNSEFGINNIQASIYTIWQHQFQILLLNNKKLTESQRICITNHAFFQIYYFNLIKRLSSNPKNTPEDFLLCQNQYTRQYPYLNPCITNMITAFNRLEFALHQWFGTYQQNQWKWGNIHKKSYHATPWTIIPFIKNWWNHQIPAGGNSRTLNVGIHTFQKKGFKTFATAVFRFITDLNKTLYSIDLGVSDRISSPYFNNFLYNHTVGEYVEYKQMNPEKQETGWTLKKWFKN